MNINNVDFGLYVLVYLGLLIFFVVLGILLEINFRRNKYNESEEIKE